MIYIGLHPNMSFEEIVEYYSLQSHYRGMVVTRRSEVSNIDMNFHRFARCLCGHCWDAKVCACGLDRVMHGRECITCGRPWWCER